MKNELDGVCVVTKGEPKGGIEAALAKMGLGVPVQSATIFRNGKPDIVFAPGTDIDFRPGVGEALRVSNKETGLQSMGAMRVTSDGCTVQGKTYPAIKP